MGNFFFKTGRPHEAEAKELLPALDGVGPDAEPEPPAYDGDDTYAGDQLKVLCVSLERHPEELKAALSLCPSVFRIADGQTLLTYEARPAALAAIAWFKRHRNPYVVERDNGVLRQIGVGEADGALGSHA